MVVVLGVAMVKWARMVASPTNKLVVFYQQTWRFCDQMWRGSKLRWMVAKSCITLDG